MNARRRTRRTSDTRKSPDFIQIAKSEIRRHFPAVPASAFFKSQLWLRNAPSISVISPKFAPPENFLTYRHEATGKMSQSLSTDRLFGAKIVIYKAQQLREVVG